MKSFEIKALGLEEMTADELCVVEGGTWWVQLLKEAAKIIGGAAASWGFSELMDHLKNNKNDVPDDWCYWSYGGELEAAVCIG